MSKKKPKPPADWCDVVTCNCGQETEVKGDAVGQIRGFRTQIVGFDVTEETGFARETVLVPEEGEPAIWNGSEWELVEDLIKDETRNITSEILPDGTIYIEELKGEQK